MIIDLSTEEGYSIATALRGPDSDDWAFSLMKAMFTAVLRYYCSIDPYSGSLVNSPPEAMEVWKLTTKKEREQFTKAVKKSHHFMGHWEFAIRSLLCGDLIKDGEKRQLRRYLKWLHENKISIINLQNAGIKT